MKYDEIVQIRFPQMRFPQFMPVKNIRTYLSVQDNKTTHQSVLEDIFPILPYYQLSMSATRNLFPHYEVLGSTTTHNSLLQNMFPLPDHINKYRFARETTFTTCYKKSSLVLYSTTLSFQVHSNSPPTK